MLFDIQLFLAVPAYAGFVVCLSVLASRLPCPCQPHEPLFPADSGLRPGLANMGLFPALAVFFLLPPGTLPPFFPAPLATIVVLLLFSTVLACLAATSPANRESAIHASMWGLLPLATAAALCIWLASRFGLPGSPFNPATLTTMPLWSMMPLTGRAGLTCIIVALCAGLGKAFPTSHSAPLAWHAMRLGMAQLLIAMLLPVTPSWLFFAEMFAFAPVLDFVSNWVLVLVLVQVVMPLAAYPVKTGLSVYVFLLAGVTLCAWSV